MLLVGHGLKSLEGPGHPLQVPLTDQTGGERKEGFQEHLSLSSSS